MRVLVVGATGYIGNRLIGTLLERGDDVVAGARTPSDLDAFWWADRVDRVELDMTSSASVDDAVTDDLDAVVYLVHGMAKADFADVDAACARNLREAVDAAGVPRVVYLSGIIPDVDRDDLSEHLQSRLQVEEILDESAASVITLRAAMVLGAGSTSYELMTQLAARMPVTLIPSWMRSAVEPVAVVDVVRAIVGALDLDGPTQWFDIGGGEKLPYPDLISRVSELRGDSRPQLPLGPVPEALVSKVAGLIADVPSHTVTALMESLREDMVAGTDRWRTALLDGAPVVGIDEAVGRASAPVDFTERPSRRDPLGPLPGDPDWAASE